MEHLDYYMLDAITTLRQKKRQPDEDSILNILSSKMESLTKEKLDSQLNELLKQQRIYNKPHCGNNSYYQGRYIRRTDFSSCFCYKVL